MTEKQPTRPARADDPSAGRDDTGETPLPESAADLDAGTSETGDPDDVVEQLRLDLAEVTDRALRAQAELENYRRRIARQMQEERRYANMPLLRDVLPVVDNMRRAIEAAEMAEDVAGLLEGFQMVTKQLEDVLDRHHCAEIEALGSPFDPNLHEAISQQPSDDYPAGTVMFVTQPGFLLHDRVVRPSQVIVSGAPPRQQPGQDDLEGS